MDGAGTSTAAPTLPDRPNNLNSVVNQTASNYANQSRFGTNAYSSPYSSYSRFGGGYGSGLGGYGGYGGGMGSMYSGGMYGGGGMYGSSMYGGYGYGGPGGPYGNMDPNGPPSLTQSWNQSTAATFQIIESIVGAFGGFAQMLESAYMTTHSSFFGKTTYHPSGK